MVEPGIHIHVCLTPDPVFLASVLQFPVNKMYKYRAGRDNILVLGIRKSFVKEVAFGVGSEDGWVGFWQAKWKKK